MKVMKKRTFSGAVCEQIVFRAAANTVNIKKAEPRPRFKDETERLEHRLEISRKKHAQLVNANFFPGDLYCTLTFDDEHEVHYFEDARRIRDNYFRRLKRKYKDAVIFIYMGKGENTDRIHLHMLARGIPEEYVCQQWREGKVKHIRPLREHNYYDGKDCGQDYTGLANYLFGHWTPEQGGHRWKATRNTVKPTVEDATECKVDYSKDRPPKAPKGYTLVEIKTNYYGYMYFKYVKLPEKKGRTKRKEKEGPLSQLR